ncbi:MAG: AAA family ATPase [Propionicimonas sp.]|uniref:HelD family protein n=1 Tax=Propionicimonas sp. TaxID=1955623 RepID=UPI002B1F0D4C|nr:UvrD-helicase domain-containing protein [Propionicimonas sp.]MEA4943291.1 AAA family ATPase [Propionicimonas sp.]
MERELAAEQAHVDLVYRHLDLATKSAREVAREGQRRYTSDRETWVREEDGTALFERDAFAFQAARRLAVLDAEHEGLVFGRLDSTAGETSYIGRIGVRDDDYEPLVIDWRARAAEPFYRATATDPMDVVRRRVLRCRNDKVIGIEDDLLDATAQHQLVIVGEGALMASLKRARGNRMRSIVDTIQAEQDEAIRADHNGVTVIAGGPGTGKTVVALHRAAYLLYSNRRRYERGGILVVGPSALFMNYIERVLPSLGEDSVTLRAIGQVASDTLGFGSDLLDDATAATIKGSLRMLPVLKRLVNLPLLQGGAGDPLLRVTVKGEVLTLTTAELAAIRREVLARFRVNAGRAAAEESVLDALYARLPGELGMDRDTMADLVTSSASYRMFLQAWWPDLDALAVLRRLADPQVVARVAGGILNEPEQAALAHSFDRAGWTVADTALLDELVALLGPVEPDDTDEPLIFLPDGTEVTEVVTTADRLATPRERDPQDDPYTTFAHLLVDEAQDITPMQWRMLRRRGAHASWTIVGDPAQSSWPDQAETRQVMDALIDGAPHRSFRLSTNYRSPAEVFDLAAQVVKRAYPDADLPDAIRRTGVEPLLLTTTEDGLADRLDALIADLAEQVQGTIGVIVPPSRLAALATASTGRPGTLAASERLSFVSPLGAKGLEYDAVIVVSPDQIVAESPGGERVLYVALTRPTQRLVTLDVGGSPAAWRESLLSPSIG